MAAQIALNGLPTKNDGIYRDKGLQPLGNGSARMLDVLIARHKRSLVGRLLEQVPALSLLPAGCQQMPSFELAIRKRDLPTLHLLLVASCRAPLPLRGLVASKVIPRLAAERLSSAVSSFLCDPAVCLERSGALIELASPRVDGLTYQLHPSWGGVGTRIWEEVDVKREHAPGPASIGVHVRPKRVPLPGLTSRAALAALSAHGCCHHAGRSLPLFNTPCMRAVVQALWTLQFAPLNRVRVCACALHLLLLLLFAYRVLDGPEPPLPGAPLSITSHAAAAPGAAAQAGAAQPEAGWRQWAHLTLSLLLVAINSQLLVRGYLNARGQPASVRRAALRSRDAAFAQTNLGAALVLLVVGAEAVQRVGGLGGLVEVAGLGALLEHSACAAIASRASALVRRGLVLCVCLLCERLLYSLRGIPRLTLAVVAISRAARSTAPALLAALVCFAVVAICTPLLLGVSALDDSQLMVRARARLKHAPCAHARPSTSRSLAPPLATACSAPIRPPPADTLGFRPALPFAGALLRAGARADQRGAARVQQHACGSRAAARRRRAACHRRPDRRVLHGDAAATAQRGGGALGVGARARGSGGHRAAARSEARAADESGGRGAA